MQADLRVFHRLGYWGASVISALTVQNSTGVSRVRSVPADLVRAQLQAVLSDMKIVGIKTGLLPSARGIQAVAGELRKLSPAILVIDPVDVSSSGRHLTGTAAFHTMKRSLLPLATAVTPNLQEASRLADYPVTNLTDMKSAAERIHQLGPDTVIITGGHLLGTPVDLLFDGRVFTELPGTRLPFPATHGTGCAYSSALTAFRAAGLPLADAAFRAQEYVRDALQNAKCTARGKRISPG